MPFNIVSAFACLTIETKRPRPKRPSSRYSYNRCNTGCRMQAVSFKIMPNQVIGPWLNELCGQFDRKRLRGAHHQRLASISMSLLV
ncbi:hypothetical protein FOXYSP1_07170 [Fusarium oxysporum f. sp. phaseoli]